MSDKARKPKILALDIETSPILAYVWDIWDQNISLNQIHTDWCVLSWAAKWISEPNSKLLYMDQRKAKDITNDRKILEGIWKLLDECDILLTQNGRRFDVRKLNARFVQHGMTPPSSFKHVDTLRIAKKHFAFTSHKLEHMTSLLCPKNKKSAHKKFPGFELWKECLDGNLKAWNEMENYNKQDIVALENLYNKIKNWDDTFNPSLYRNDNNTVCTCGSKDFEKRGFVFTAIAKFQRFKCKKCGAWTRSRENMFSKEKKKSLRVKV